MPRRPQPDSRKGHEERTLRFTTALAVGMLAVLALVVLLYLLL